MFYHSLVSFLNIWIGGEWFFSHFRFLLLLFQESHLQVWSSTFGSCSKPQHCHLQRANKGAKNGAGMERRCFSLTLGILHCDVSNVLTIVCPFSLRTEFMVTEENITMCVNGWRLLTDLLGRRILLHVAKYPTNPWILLAWAIHV